MNKTFATILAGAALAAVTTAGSATAQTDNGTEPFGLPGTVDWSWQVDQEPDAANFVARPWDRCSQFPGICRGTATLSFHLHPSMSIGKALSVCGNQGGRLDINGPERVELDTRPTDDGALGWLCYDVDR